MDNGYTVVKRGIIKTSSDISVTTPQDRQHINPSRRKLTAKPQLLNPQAGESVADVPSLFELI